MATSVPSDGPPMELGQPQFQSHAWLEPIIVLSIMIGSLVLNRRRNFSIFKSRYDTGPFKACNDQSSDCLLNGVPDDSSYATSSSSSSDDLLCSNPYTSRVDRVCGIAIDTPDTSRWADYIHSRILQKFPFLVEMFYWAVNYLFYICTKTISAYFSPADISVVQVAQDHGVGILHIEHDSPFGFLFPVQESDFQYFFLENHKAIMTFFNRIYSLVHIPGTVLFLSWYYYAAPSHNTFAIARRTMTLGNFAAFFIFCLFPCMPPRLLPDEYNFYDTVRQEHAESVWVNSKSVNQFAAMPSLHFTYAFVIGSTFIYHSGILQRLRGLKPRTSVLTELIFTILGITYPLLVLNVIVATANHYWLDALVAVFTVTLCFLGNRIMLLLLPLEYLICWVLRLAKPIPTTGDRLLRRREQWKLEESRSLTGYQLV